MVYIVVNVSRVSSNTLWAATLVAVSALAVSTVGAQQPEVWKDPGGAMETRANDLLSRMTLEEKVSQMMNDSPAIPRLNIPACNWWNESLHGVARAAMWDTDQMFRVAEAISDEARAKYKSFWKK